MERQPLYTVGVVVNTHGIRGEVKVYPRTDFPDKRFRAGSRLLLVHPSSNDASQTVEVVSARKHKQFYIVKFDGISLMEEAEKIKGWELKISESELEKLPEGTYYIHELVGCTVIDENGQVVGVLKDVLQPGANDVYVVSRETGRDVLLPAIPDVVLDVDPVQKTMIVHILEGLIEE